MFSDRRGARRLVAAVIFLWSVFTGLTAAAWGYASMFIFRLLFGVSEAALSRAIASAFKEYVYAERRSTAFGFSLPEDGWEGCFSISGSDWHSCSSRVAARVPAGIAPGGAQSVYGVTPDLATLGKAIGGGVPLSVVAGRKEILELIVDGGVAFGGTFNRNPLSMAGAHATLTEMSRDGGRVLADAVQLGEQLMQGIAEAGKRRGVQLQVTGFGTCFSVHFTERTKLTTYRDTLQDNTVLLREWFQRCLAEGIYLLPDGRRVYLSVVHTSDQIERTVHSFERLLAQCAVVSSVSN